MPISDHSQPLSPGTRVCHVIHRTDLGAGVYTREIRQGLGLLISVTLDAWGLTHGTVLWQDPPKGGGHRNLQTYLITELSRDIEMTDSCVTFSGPQ